MLFRESTSSVHSSVDLDECSSSGSLASTQSYATRAFEKKMQLLAEDVPNIGINQEEDDKELTDEMKTWAFDVNLDEEDSQVSCINRDTDAGWSELMRRWDSASHLDTRFYEYPPSEHFKTCPLQQSALDEHAKESSNSPSHSHGTKIFIGGLRFEVVQSGRHMISWIFEVACGVRLPPASILVHRKAKGGRSGSPTGCASVFITSEEDVEHMLAMNQRIFCSEKGIYVADSAAKMTELIESKSIPDLSCGRVRGPTHPVIIERAYSAAGRSGPRNSDTTSRNEAAVNEQSLSCEMSASSISGTLSHSSAMSLHGNPSQPIGADASGGGSSLLRPGSEPAFHTYPGEAEAENIFAGIPVEVSRPADLFIGGLAAEVSREFVAWAFSIIGVKVHPRNVAPYAASQSTGKGGCALVRIEECDVPTATKFTKRVLCESRGVYVVDTPHAIVSLLSARDKAAGPMRPLIIKKKSAPKRAAPVPPMAVPIGQPPPLPPPFPGAQTVPWPVVPVVPDRPPPPPYMQNVIIGNQAYQLPVGASIQLQLVPVITAPAPMQANPGPQMYPVAHQMSMPLPQFPPR